MAVLDTISLGGLVQQWAAEETHCGGGRRGGGLPAHHLDSFEWTCSLCTALVPLYVCSRGMAPLRRRGRRAGAGVAVSVLVVAAVVFVSGRVKSGGANDAPTAPQVIQARSPAAPAAASACGAVWAADSAGACRSVTKRGALQALAPKLVQAGGASTAPREAKPWMTRRWPSDAPTRRKPGLVPSDIKRRCEGTRGSWCVDFHTQEEVPAVTAPRGNKTCSLDCNLVRPQAAVGHRRSCCHGILLPAVGARWQPGGDPPSCRCAAGRYLQRAHWLLHVPGRCVRPPPSSCAHDALSGYCTWCPCCRPQAVLPARCSLRALYPWQPLRLQAGRGSTACSP
jgi:hypothetical protein